jgi:hypothetical protein
MKLTRVPFPSHLDRTALVDELIWGHRLRDDQTAWLLILEMLNVAEACLRAGDVLADMGSAYAPEAKPRLRVRLRNLLFRLNQKAAELAAAVQAGVIDSDQAWDTWLVHAREEYEGPGTADYTPLRHRFDDFIQFERAVDLIRSTAIGGLEGQKSIWNRFIFPIAPEALFWEVSIKTSGGESRPDHTANSFTRAGTLLHIMLARSGSASTLRKQLSAFLDRDSQGRRLVKLLQIDEPADERNSPRTYLPFASHHRFDKLGEDFASILALKAPDNDKLQWLAPLAALHLSLYHAEVAGEQILEKTLPLPLVCEIVASRKTPVREASINSFLDNSDLARQAVDKFLDAAFSSSEWTQLLSDESTPVAEKTERARAFIRRTLNPPAAELGDPDDTRQPEQLRQEITQFFRDRHRREFSKVHSEYGKEAGLVSKRATNRYRYAPTDLLLQSIIFANVPDETPLESFLDRLFLRYGIVIGQRQQAALEAAGYSETAETISSQAFRNNQNRLEARLKSMGMLRRLSDSQAYVVNPLQSPS